jgi:putative ABC transport system substrate-binding protein
MIRAFVLCLAIAAAGAHAQQPAPKRVGYFSAASAEANAPRIAAFRRGMSELGWVDGKDYIVDARYGATNSANISQLAADVIASRPDVIVTASDGAIRALMKGTKTIPIVFATANDPLGLGPIKSLQRPGGNATGLSSLRGPISAKGVQLLKETFPKISHIGLIFEPTDEGSFVSHKEILNAADRLGLQVTRIDINAAKDIAPSVRRGIAQGSQGFVVVDGFLFISQRKALVEAINRSRLPSVYARSEYVDGGGLMSYGVPTVENYRRAASYVDKILKGAKPGDLAIEQPSTFELIVNMRTAKAAGIAIPTSLLVRADKVIQ